MNHHLPDIRLWWANLSIKAETTWKAAADLSMIRITTTCHRINHRNNITKVICNTLILLPRPHPFQNPHSLPTRPVGIPTNTSISDPIRHGNIFPTAAAAISVLHSKKTCQMLHTKKFMVRRILEGQSNTYTPPDINPCVHDHVLGSCRLWFVFCSLG